MKKISIKPFVTLEEAACNPKEKEKKKCLTGYLRFCLDRDQLLLNRPQCVQQCYRVKS